MENEEAAKAVDGTADKGDLLATARRAGHPYQAGQSGAVHFAFAPRRSVIDSAWLLLLLLLVATLSTSVWSTESELLCVRMRG